MKCHFELKINKYKFKQLKMGGTWLFILARFQSNFILVDQIAYKF